MGMSLADARRLGLVQTAVPARAKPRRSRPQGYPPDTKNGHVWQREGRGVRCQCGMWLPWQRLPLFGHGDWEAALRGGNRT